MKRLDIWMSVFLAGIIGMLSVNAQETKILTADKHNEYGLIYNLPNTALRVDVVARRNVSKVGPYYQYSKKFLGTDKVVKQDSESWEIVEANISSYGVSNTKERYLMQLKNGQTTFLCVADDGMLLSINKKVDPIAPLAPLDLPSEGGNVKLDINEYLQYVNEDFVASQSSAKRAQMLAENLMEVRDAIASLTRGTSERMPTDGKQLELMLNSLTRQEKALMAAFVGMSGTETVARSFVIVPERDQKIVLFRLSDFSGFVDADDYSGAPVYLEVEMLEQGKLPVDAKGEVKKLPKDAVIYNIPGLARVSLKSAGQQLFTKDLPLAQFGTQFGLDPKLFTSKKNRSYAIFDSVTGGIIEIADGAE